MNKYLSVVYRSLALMHHLYAAKYISDLEFQKSQHQRIVNMERFNYTYFTGWNMMIQTIFLTVAVATDILRFFPESFSKYESTLLQLKGYIFTAFMFPCSLFVSGMFWFLYTINREWVLPLEVDGFVPEWVNHSLHTIILIPAIAEMLLTNHLLPSFKTAFIGLTTLLLTYNSLYFFTYYKHGVWPYELFYILNWHGRISVMAFSYLCIVFMMRIGFGLHYLKGRYVKNIFQKNWMELTKGL